MPKAIFYLLEGDYMAVRSLVCRAGRHLFFTFTVLSVESEDFNTDICSGWRCMPLDYLSNVFWVVELSKIYSLYEVLDPKRRI